MFGEGNDMYGGKTSDNSYILQRSVTLLLMMKHNGFRLYSSTITPMTSSMLSKVKSVDTAKTGTFILVLKPVLALLLTPEAVSVTSNLEAFLDL